jgi:3-oxoacyl-[acyl-carrier-protein] synthase II
MGPSNTITCQEASAHLAIGEAFRTLQRGKADLAICGGAESRLNPMGLIRQQLLKRLCETSNDAPTAAVRPFDEGASGTVFGEGGGLLILEELEYAKRRGAKIYAEVVGFAASQDVTAVNMPDPDGASYARAVERAIADAKLSVDDIDLILPNGLGIPAADRSELNGLARAFGERLASIPISPIKAQIGCLGAGCGVDAATAVLSVHHGRIPPGVNTKQGVDGRKLNVSPVVREGQVRTAISTVSSVGGQNAALVLQAADGL